MRIDKVTLQIFCQNNNFVIKLKPLLRIHCISHCPILPSTLNKLNTLPTFPNQENPLINCFLASCHSLSVNFDRLMVFLLPFILHSKLIKKSFFKVESNLDFPTCNFGCNFLDSYKIYKSSSLTFSASKVWTATCKTLFEWCEIGKIFLRNLVC